MIETHGFYRRAWFDMLSRHCFADQPLLLPEIHIGEASVFLPLVQERDRLASLSNYYSFSYAPIFKGADSQDIRNELLTRIAADLRRSYGRLSLYPLIDDDDDMPALLQHAFANAGWTALLNTQGSNHIVDVNGRDFAAYWKARPGALRSSVKRKGRNGNYRYEIHARLGEALWNEYLTIYAASWKEPEPYPDMVRAIAEEAAERGALHLGIMRDDGRAVAAQLWTIEGDTACIHKIAHDIRDDPHSPGTLLSHHMFAYMIDIEKVTHIDYGTGDNAYKQDWMERARPMLRLDCFNPAQPSQWLPAMKTRISQLVGRHG